MANKIIVVKIGTSILRKNRGLGLDKSRVKDIIKQVVELKKTGNHVILVTSGAIALGMQLMKFKKRPHKLDELQAAASVGQGMLIKLYNDIFRKYGLLGGQVLLTYGDFNDRRRYLNAKSTIIRLIEHGIIPVINENDAISVEEIKVGDNDKLSALVANLVEAHMLIILSNVDGLYDHNGNLIEIVTDLNDKICKMALGTTEETSVGGMTTKLEAACITCNAGIPCVVANGRNKNIMPEVLSGKFIGTTFVPSNKKLEAKKRWLAFGSKPKGKIIVDDGAKKALAEGKSLLAVGVVDIDGRFEAGDVVSVFSNKSEEISRGIVRCGSEELRTAKGNRFKHEIIHRDNLVSVGQFKLKR